MSKTLTTKQIKRKIIKVDNKVMDNTREVKHLYKLVDKLQNKQDKLRLKREALVNLQNNSSSFALVNQADSIKE